MLKEVKIAKETDEVLALVEAIVVTVKNKGNYTELIDELVSAVEGADKIGEESKDKEALHNTVALRLVSIVEAITA